MVQFTVVYATEAISTYLKSDLRYKFSVLDINHPAPGHSYIYVSNMWDRWLLFEASRGCKQTTFGKQCTTLRTWSYFWKWGKSRTIYCTAASFRPIQTHGILNTTKSAKQHTYMDFEITVGAKHNNDEATKIHVDLNARPSNTKQESIHYATAAHGPVVKLLILITIACCSRGLTV